MKVVPHLFPDAAAFELDAFNRAFDIGSQVDRPDMRLVRTIMAVMIALSVAMLPVAGSAASIADATQDAADLMSSAAKAMSMQMAMSDMSGTMHAMDECCPDHMKAKPCDQPTHQCPVGCCTASPTSLASAAVTRLDVPVAAGQLLPIPVDQVVALHSGSPLFRPPRI
jgi:hypothetical protein